MVERATKVMKIAIYARYSSDKQSDASIDDQVRRAQAKITSLGCDPTSAQVFTDYAVSGASMERPGIQAMLTAIRSGHVEMVVTESVDRITRDAQDAFGFRKLLKSADVQLECLDGTRLDATDKNSLLMFGLRSMLSEQYLVDLADKTLRGLEGRAKAGKATGVVPYGYIITPDKSIEVHPDQAKVVRRIFSLYRDGHSFAGIAKLLNTEDIQPPRASNRRAGSGWMSSAIREQLINEKYIGRWVFGERVWTKVNGNKRVARPRKGGPLDVQERPDLRIVPDALWQDVQDRFAGRELGPIVKRNYLMSGLARCAQCGGLMNCVGGQLGKRRYGCDAARKRGTCDNRKTIRIDVLERAVFDEMRDQLALRINRVRQLVAEEAEEWRRSMQGRTDDLERQIRDLESKAGNLVDAIADRGATPLLLDKLQAAEKRLANKRAELVSAVVQAPPLPPLEAIVAQVASLDDMERDPLVGRERLRRILVDERIDCTPTESGYELRWAIDAATFLFDTAKAKTLGVSSEGVASRVYGDGCGGHEPALWTPYRIEFLVAA